MLLVAFCLLLQTYFIAFCVLVLAYWSYVVCTFDWEHSTTSGVSLSTFTCGAISTSNVYTQNTSVCAWTSFRLKSIPRAELNFHRQCVCKHRRDNWSSDCARDRMTLYGGCGGCRISWNRGRDVNLMAVLYRTFVHLWKLCNVGEATTSGFPRVSWWPC